VVSSPRANPYLSGGEGGEGIETGSRPEERKERDETSGLSRALLTDPVQKAETLWSSKVWAADLPRHASAHHVPSGGAWVSWWAGGCVPAGGGRWVGNALVLVVTWLLPLDGRNEIKPVLSSKLRAGRPRSCVFEVSPTCLLGWS
jgi:hypothetical protein